MLSSTATLVTPPAGIETRAVLPLASNYRSQPNFEERHQLRNDPGATGNMAEVISLASDALKEIPNGLPTNEERPRETSPRSNFTPVNGGQSPRPQVTGTVVPREHENGQRANAEGQARSNRLPSMRTHEESYDHSEAANDRTRRTTSPVFGSEAYAATPGKRKRSPSETSPSSAEEPHRPQFPNGAFHDRSVVRAPEQRQPGSHYYSDSQVTGSSNQPVQYRHPEAASREQHWYTQQRVISPEASDARLAEALRREAQTIDSGHRSRDGSPEDDEGLDRPDYGTDRVAPPGVQVDHKKRKRVFSNRTKTGCITCRRRKKKCDEGKPECNNCMRGGFLCGGYPTKSTWAKQPPMKGPVPLKPQGGYPEHPAEYSRYPPERYHEMSTHASIENGRPYPGMHEAERASHVDWSKPTWPDSNRPTYLSEHLPRTDFTGVPPLSELSREPARDNHATAPGPSYRPLAQTLPTPSRQSTMNSNQSAMTAQLALQHQSSLPPPSHTSSARAPSVTAPQQSEKEKMLEGGEYLPYCASLIDEREQCKAAVWRFNNAANPNFGISREERARLFRAILEPPHLRRTHSQANPIGSVGHGVCVDAPFHCDYGYNIHIGDDVVIGTNCTILDPRTVSIGKRTIIGPNVCIYGQDMETDPKVRNGSKGRAFGKPIYIEEDCYIGGNTIILPGVTIHKGSTVAAGSVVTKDIAPYSVAMGRPAVVKRGLYADPSDRR